jgi:hypothetical protein
MGKPRQGISVDVLAPRAVLYLHIVLAQFLEPPGQLILRGLKIEQPNQTVMISPSNKSPPQQVMAIHAGEPDYRQQLLARSAILPLIPSQIQAPVCYGPLHALLYLTQLCPNGVS